MKLLPKQLLRVALRNSCAYKSRKHLRIRESPTVALGTT